MTALLALAAELLGPMLDAAQEPETAAARSLRFAVLLDRDTELAHQLTDPVLTAGDLADAPLGVWTWWLEWRRTRSATVPSAGFLDALYHASGDPLTRFRVVQSEAWHPSWIRAYSERLQVASGLEAVPEGFLGDGLRQVLLGDGADHVTDAADGEEVSGLDPDEVATHLLQLGDQFSLSVLRAMLDTDRAEHEEFRERFGPLLQVALEDE